MIYEHFHHDLLGFAYACGIFMSCKARAGSDQCNMAIEIDQLLTEIRLQTRHCHNRNINETLANTMMKNIKKKKKKEKKNRKRDSRNDMTVIIKRQNKGEMHFPTISGLFWALPTISACCQSMTSQTQQR